MTKSLNKRRRVSSGQTFGWLIAVDQNGSEKGHSIWVCLCKCGATVTTTAGHLLNGQKKSCGCLQRERPSNLRHGHTSAMVKNNSNPEWRAHCAWVACRARCRHPGNENYPRYGGRGITYDPRWELFENFLVDMGPPPVGTSLDRIDNNGPYSKANCCWASKERQMRNRSNCRHLSHGGRTQTMAEWARELGIGHSALIARLDRGWSLDRALSEPGVSKTNAPATSFWSGVMSMGA